MYIIELIIKKFFSKKNTDNYNPIDGFDSINYENCEHIFMPIDSTNEILSCSKCGVLVKKSDLKPRNFFMH